MSNTDIIRFDPIKIRFYGLLPSAKNATSPINISCNTIKFGDINNNYFIELNEVDKQAILDKEFEITELARHNVIISEIDMKNATCMVSLHDDLKRRFKARITDPKIEQSNNDYGIATNSRKVVTIIAKQRLDKGIIKEFIISDIILNQSNSTPLQGE